ncbi:carboxymuconolactone decarboxylase family protein [Rhodobacteraceae bacterium N5(2021)]|uniref:Carboxymuconolactone decarboxylase family protein n=1 Tax=Gymnodinialimonas phycosphaerae TaxID=2841589 RepID=A0A975YFX5_9RHOB|nr:carboxymuconolactone decarboxylase family protein [Gymnodinialimonas phycosphaerae]MBY4895214.1 carboxymuconolactone decarboxylase family protein [Gymnodinialimonas phycosphaerae]
MSDAPHNPFESLFKQTQEMTEAWLKAAAPALASGRFDKMWPEVPPEMLEAFLGKQFNPEGLEAKTRLLLTLQGLTIQGALAEMQIRTTVRQAISVGATPQEIAETIGLASLFGGAPAMTKAMELARQAIDGDGEDD